MQESPRKSEGSRTSRTYMFDSPRQFNLSHDVAIDEEITRFRSYAATVFVFVCQLSVGRGANHGWRD